MYTVFKEILAVKVSKGLTVGQKVVIAILLIIPLVVYMAYTTYDFASPSLGGVPFFYWYQTLWLAISSLLFIIAAVLWERWLSGR